MTQRDNISEAQMVDLGVVSLSGTTPAASAWVDTRGFDAAALYVMTNTVTDAGTADGFSFVMQESDTTAAADATTVATAEILGSLSDLTVTGNGDDNILVGGVGYVGNSRYVRLNGTGTTGTNATVRVMAVLSRPATGVPANVGSSVAAT